MQIINCHVIIYHVNVCHYFLVVVINFILVCQRMNNFEISNDFVMFICYIKSSQELNLVGERVTDSNTTHVDSSLDLEVSVVTPSSSPRVLDYPIILSIFSSISDGKYGMVDVLLSILTSSRAVDSGAVVTEISNNLEGD